MPGVSLHHHLTEILADEDKVLFAEAVNCADAGSYRAAWVMLWLCCAESLKRRFKDLASRDHNASRVVADIARHEGLRHSVDFLILTEAKTYGFLTASEYIRLEYLYTQRCIYGHPYEEQPRPESLVAAAAELVQIVLNRPTKLREGFLSEQVRLVTTETAYLDDTLEAVERYTTELVPKVAETLHLWFLQKLWSVLEPLANDPTSLLVFRRGVWLSAAYLREVLGDVVPAWDVVADLARRPATLAIVLSEPALFAAVPLQAQDMIVGLLVQEAQLNHRRFPRIEALNSAGVLTERQTERINSMIVGLPLDTVVQSGLNPALYIDRIIAELKILTWSRQNPAAAVLINLGPIGISRISPEKQFVVGNNVLQAADGTAHTARALLARIANATEQWPACFVEGILCECFVNDASIVRFKGDQRRALECVKAVSPVERVPLVDRVAARIDAGTRMEYPTILSDSPDAIATIRALVNESPETYSALSSLETALLNKFGLGTSHASVQVALPVSTPANTSPAS